MVCLFMILPSASMAQLTNVTISTDKCDYIQSNITTNPNGTTNQFFGVSTFWSPRGSFFRRAFIEFDVSSIPTNAIVYEAKLNITHVGATYVTNPWIAKLLTSSWTEGAVTPASQPITSSSSADWSTSHIESGNTVSIDVRSTVQRMVYGQILNYGWSIQVNNEAATYTSGTNFNSDENGFNQPELMVKYYLPVSLSSVTVTHESEVGANDGAIGFNHSPLDMIGHSYQWIDASGSIISTNQNLTDVSYGWYGLEITGTSNGEQAYYGFLVGTECKEVTIKYLTRPEYTNNAYVYDWVSNSGIDYKDYNFGNSTYLQTDNRYNSSTFSWVDSKSYLDFNVWMDDAFFVSEANLLVQGFYHYNSGTTNPVELNEVNEFWNEDLVTWNTIPTNSSLVSETIVNTSTSDQDATWDFKSLWDTWKLDNNENHGVIFQLEDFDDDVDAGQMYHSPNGSSINRPEWTFKLGLWEEECNVQFAHLDFEMDGYYHIMKSGKIRFIFDQQYDADILEFNIYDYHDDLVKTQADFTAVNTTYGDNYLTIDVSTSQDCIGRGFFYLEVITSKNEKLYLRFFNDFSTPGCTDTQP